MVVSVVFSTKSRKHGITMVFMDLSSYSVLDKDLMDSLPLLRLHRSFVGQKISSNHARVFVSPMFYLGTVPIKLLR